MPSSVKDLFPRSAHRAPQFQRSAPPWLSLLNALHREWRESQIQRGGDPDAYIEKNLREAGRWPQPDSKRAIPAPTNLHL